MEPKKEVLRILELWWNNLPVYSATGGTPAKGTVAGALAVLERLKENFVLELDAHTAKGGSQIKGASGTAVKRILAAFDESRPFVSEGGRTNRGLRNDIKNLLDALNKAGLESLSSENRRDILRECQQFLVEKVKDFHNRQRLRPIYDPSKSTWQYVRDLLNLARDTGKEGPIAQYLVGAKLQLRFPNEKIRNESYSTSDDQSNLPGDFVVGNTAFHITVAPMPPVYDKCARNLNDGFRVYLLVPDRSLAGARQNADLGFPGKIAVESIESFVAQNIEEISTFSKTKLSSGIRSLLETYNARVAAVEFDKSMLIDIPPNL